MEEMANAPIEEQGKRYPGEKGAYERQNVFKASQSDFKGSGLPL